MLGIFLYIGYGWEWKMFGDSEESVVYGVALPQGYFLNMPTPYPYRILTGNNLELGGLNDHTVLTLYNMLENIDEKLENMKYVPMA